MADEKIGHAAPVLVAKDGHYRAKLLARLKELAPNSDYVCDEKPFRPTTVRVLDELGQESWSWTLPLMAYNRWILTVEEFLYLEIRRYSGPYEEDK